jgi:peptide/nickel transport system permease protein
MRARRAPGCIALRVGYTTRYPMLCFRSWRSADCKSANMLAFTLLTETVFQWPGMGFLFLEGRDRADVPLITTYLVAVGYLFVVTNTLADVVSLWLDPRISLEGRR